MYLSSFLKINLRTSFPISIVLFFLIRFWIEICRIRSSSGEANGRTLWYHGANKMCMVTRRCCMPVARIFPFLFTKAYDEKVNEFDLCKHLHEGTSLFPFQRRHRLNWKLIRQSISSFIEQQSYVSNHLSCGGEQEI